MISLAEDGRPSFPCGTKCCLVQSIAAIAAHTVPASSSAKTVVPAPGGRPKVVSCVQIRIRITQLAHAKSCPVRII
jgi:hypothetical protein